MAHIINSGHNLLPRYSNNMIVSNPKVINPRKVKLLKPVTNSWGAVLEQYDKGKPPNIETHI